MRPDVLQRIQDWLDDLIGRGEKIKTTAVTDRCLADRLYDKDERYQAMLEGLNQKSRAIIRGRFRFLGRSFVASGGVFRQRAYQRDRFLTSDEMKERHQYFAARDAQCQRQAAYWAKLHGAAYGVQLPLGFMLPAGDQELVDDWVNNEMK